MATKKMIAAALAGMMLVPAGISAADKFIDSDDYKEKDFKSCNIKDYADMVEGDDVDWVWVAPDLKTANTAISLRKVENKAKRDRKSVNDAVKSAYEKNFADMKEVKGAQPLKADVCIYETQEYSPGKAWIPFAGGHQMQAGIGIEMVLSDKNNKTVAKLRHFARQGIEVEQAAYEVAEDMIDYLSEH